MATKSKTNSASDSFAQHTGEEIISNQLFINSLPITVVTNIIDRWEGLSQTFEIWGSTPSVRYVTAVLSNDDDRQALAQFFISRRFSTVFKSLIKTHSIRPNECLLVKTDLFTALNKFLTVAQAGVALELILPLMLKLGSVSGTMRYSNHIRYGFKTVDTEDVRNDVATYQVLQAVKATTTSNINPNTKYSTSALAEELADAYRKIGLELYEVNDLAVVVGDMVKGVRANLDPSLSYGILHGSVSTDWKKSRVVDELSKNLVFIKAAMSIPPGSSVDLTCEGWKLEKWGPVILSALQSSERYGWVSKAESLRTYGLRKVRDVRGIVQRAIVFRSAKVQPVAQAVFALAEAELEGAFSINASRDRVADAVQSAYGSATFNTSIGADLLASVLGDAVEAGWISGSQVEELSLGLDEADVCCMLASRIHVTVPSLQDNPFPEFDDAGKPVAAAVFAPKWTYTVPTSERSFLVPSGKGEHRGDEVVSEFRDIILMAAAEFEPLDAVIPKPQVFGPTAFNSIVVGFDENVLQSTSKKFKFDIVINEIAMRGSIRPAGFASMNTSDTTSLVSPHFNRQVITTLRDSFARVNDLVNSLETSTEEDWRGSKPGAEFMTLMRRRIARALLALSQQLSPGFRNEVQNAIIDRTLSGSPASSAAETERMRARLSQRAYSACSDVLALQFFLFIQGIDEGVWADIANTTDMLRVYMEAGSDRDKAN